MVVLPSYFIVYNFGLRPQLVPHVVSLITGLKNYLWVYLRDCWCVDCGFEWWSDGAGPKLSEACLKLLGCQFHCLARNVGCLTHALC